MAATDKAITSSTAKDSPERPPETIKGTTIPVDLRYPDKQPQLAAWLIANYSKFRDKYSRENMFFVWAGHVGAHPIPVIRQLLQELDILDQKE